MSAVTEALGKQLGPLPVGAWIVVGAGGIGLGLFARRAFGGSGEDTSYVSSPETETTSAGGTNTNTAGNLYVPPAAGINEGTNLAAPTTNDEWRQSTLARLIARGYSAVMVDSAIGKYLSGDTLSAAEANVIEAGILIGGPTPQATFPIQIAPTITTPTVDPIVNIPTPVVLPKIDARLWGLSLGNDADVTVLGTAGPGGFFKGKSVSGGAPVYAKIGDKWIQNFNWDTLAPGTQIGTPGALSDYVSANSTTTDYTP